jgi:hypothetical protein
LSHRLAYLALTIIALTLALLATLMLASPAAGQESVAEIKFVNLDDSPPPEFFSGGSVALRVAGEVCLTHQLTEDEPSPVVHRRSSTSAVPTAVLFDRDGRVPACNLPPLANTTLRFTIADSRVIPGAVIVLANLTPCVLLGVTEVGAHDVVIGEEGQPAECSREGVELSFIDGRGRSLALRFPLLDGAVEVVGNWAPDPPHEEPERGRPNFDTYLGNITRCYRLFEALRNVFS